MYGFFADEPGYTRNEQSLIQSEEYNKDTRRSTVRAAYLDHLTHPDPYFGALVAERMLASWPGTKAVFERWASEDSGGNIAAHIAEIENKLLHANEKA